MFGILWAQYCHILLTNITLKYELNNSQEQICMLLYQKTKKMRQRICKKSGEDFGGESYSNQEKFGYFILRSINM